MSEVTIDEIIPYFRVLDPLKGEYVPFVPFPIQEKFLNDIREESKKGAAKIIVVKARQVGITTATLVWILAKMIVEPNSRVLALAHYDESAEDLYDKVVGMFDNLEEPLRSAISFKSRKKGKISLGNGSTMTLQTARTFDKVRLPAYSAAHLTEFAYYEDPEKLLTALLPALDKAGSKGLLVIESTVSEAAKESYYYDLAASARNDPSSPYKCVFYPWFDDPRNTITEAEADRYLPLEYDEMFSDDEETLRELYGVTDRQLAWRRKTIKSFAKFRNPLGFFRREFPATWEEAFSSGSESCFDPEALDVLEVDLSSARISYGDVIISQGSPTLVPATEGKITMRISPQGWSSAWPIVVAVDPSEGTRDGDPQGIAVVGRKEGKIYELAALCDRISIEESAKIAVALARAYHNCRLIWDANARAGAAFEAAVDKLGYYRIFSERSGGRVIKGKRITPVTKSLLVSRLKEVIEFEKLSLASTRTLDQLRNFGRKGVGYEALRGHDDAVLALGLGILALDSMPDNLDDIVPPQLYHEDIQWVRRAREPVAARRLRSLHV
jgi:phage terminase large subunit-like protein